MGVWFWCTDQSMVQSILGAKSLKQGQLGANFIGWLKILDVPLFILPGIVCFVLFPQLENPDEAYMTMVTQLFPVGLRGLIIVVLIAALISTIGSALNSLSTVFTMDVYVKKYNPSASQSTMVKTGRLVTLFGSLLAVLITLAIDSIKGLNLFDIFQSVLGFIAPPMSVVFLFGVLWKRTTTRAANLVLTLGTVLSLGIGVLYLWVFPNQIYNWPHFLLLSFYIFVGLSVMTFFVTITDKTGQENNDVLLKINPKARPDKQVKLLWLLLTLVMVFLYWFFNGH